MAVRRFFPLFLEISSIVRPDIYTKNGVKEMGASSYKAACARRNRMRKKIFATYITKQEKPHPKPPALPSPIDLLMDKGYINQAEKEMLLELGHHFHFHIMNYGKFSQSLWREPDAQKTSFKPGTTTFGWTENKLSYLKEPLRKNHSFRTFMHVLFIHHDTGAFINMMKTPAFRKELKYYLGLMLKKKKA